MSAPLILDVRFRIMSRRTPSGWRDGSGWRAEVLDDWGQVRQCCDHLHRTMVPAMRCLDQLQDKVRQQGREFSRVPSTIIGGAA